jgi:hypothetical protein
MAGEMTIVAGQMKFNDYSAQFPPDRYQFATGPGFLKYVDSSAFDRNL